MIEREKVHRQAQRKDNVEADRDSGGRTDSASLCHGATLIIQMTDLFRARETYHCTQTSRTQCSKDNSAFKHNLICRREKMVFIYFTSSFNTLNFHQ